MEEPLVILTVSVTLSEVIWAITSILIFIFVTVAAVVKFAVIPVLSGHLVSWKAMKRDYHVDGETNLRGLVKRVEVLEKKKWLI